MTAVYIIGGIVIFFTILLVNRIYINVSYKGGDDGGDSGDGGDSAGIFVSVRYLFVKIKLSPKKEKKIRISDYTYKKTHKNKTASKKKAAKAKTSVMEKSSGHENKLSALGSVSEIKEIVLRLLSMFFKHLRIDIKRIHISIGCGDAAATAITYGVVTQAAGALLTVLDEIVNIKRGMRTEVEITPDFLQPKITADIRLRFSISCAGALALFFKFIILQSKNKN